MTKEKDLKRLIRARMDKTGESYTAAKAVLSKAASPRKPKLDYALAPMSDDAVKAKTGRAWRGWWSSWRRPARPR